MTINRGITLEALLTQLGYRLDTIVVEQNGEIITREQFAATAVFADDTLEVVRFIGGG